MVVHQKKRRVICWSASLFLRLVDRQALQHLAWRQYEKEICPFPLSYIYSTRSSCPSRRRHKYPDLSPSSCPCGSFISSSSPPFSPPLLCLPLSQWKCSAGPRAPASNCWWIECFHGVLGRALPWISILTYTHTHTRTHTQHVLRYTNGLVCSLMGRGGWFEPTAAALWRKPGQAWWIFKHTHMHTHKNKERANKREDTSKLHSLMWTHAHTHNLSSQVEALCCRKHMGWIMC